MEKDFEKTPSFYANDKVFKKFLYKTSFYQGLQKNLLGIVKKLKPENVLELGFGTGQTSFLVAKQNKNSNLVSVDMRNEMVDVASGLAEKYKINNIKFVQGDMSSYVKQDLTQFDFIFMLYAFHHIPDPHQNKIEFLKQCYKNMKKGAYICIAEAFVPENLSDEGADPRILSIWQERGKESYASVFWNCLNGLDEKSIAKAETIASYSQSMELMAGELVAGRNNEYLVKISWLAIEAEKIGFKTILNENINSIADSILLFQK